MAKQSNYPDDWQTKPISEVCTHITDCLNRTAPVEDGVTPYKMLRTVNVGDGFVDTQDVRFVSQKTYDKWTRRGQPKYGDIILTREAPLGNIGMLRTDELCFLGQRLVMYRANPVLVDNEYLLYTLLSHDLQKQIQILGNGSTVEHMRVADCHKLKIHFPPLAEQRAIATILGTWDEAIALTEALIAALQQRKKGLMQKLLTGDVRFSQFDDEWEEVQLRNVINIEYGKSPKDIVNDEGQYLIYGTGGVYGRTDDFICDKPSIIIGRKGTLSEPLLVTEPYWAIDTTFYCTAKNGEVVRFIHYVLDRKNLARYNEGSSIPSLSRNTLYTIKILLPSVGEQSYISDVLAICDDEIELLGQHRDKLQQQKKGLMQQLLTGQVRVRVE